MNLNPVLGETQATAHSLDATPPGDSSPAASPQCSEPPGTSRDGRAQARAALQPMMDPKRKLTNEERHALVLQVDEILGLDQYEHDFEHQTPATGIIRLGRDEPSAAAEARVGGSATSEIRSSKQGPLET